MKRHVVSPSVDTQNYDNPSLEVMEYNRKDERDTSFNEEPKYFSSWHQDVSYRKVHGEKDAVNYVSGDENNSIGNIKLAKT